MNRIKMLAATLLAVGAVGVAGLAAAQPASAHPRLTCEQAAIIYNTYMGYYYLYMAMGAPVQATVYKLQAEDIQEEYC